MSEQEKNTAVQVAETDTGTVLEGEAGENARADGRQSAAGKIKKLFSVQSPYADYAADNDKVSQMMYDADAEPPKPTAKDLLRTVFSALMLVLVFIGAALLFSMAGTCLGLK